MRRRSAPLLPALLFAFSTPVLGAQTSSTAELSASPLHGYVLGRAATSGDALDDAARFFDAAYAQDPTATVLAQRAFDLAVASGDKTRAFALARRLRAAGESKPDLAVLLLADAVLRKDWKAAEAFTTEIAPAGYAGVAVPIIEAWIAFGRRDVDAALASLDPEQFQGFTRAYVAEQRAHMLAASGRFVEAAAAYSSLRTSTASGISFVRQGEADAVAETGDRTRALAILDGSDPTTVAARARLQAGKRIGALAPDSRHGLAWLAGRLAADLSRERPVRLAILFARTATFLAPETASTWLIAGDVLARSGQREAALVAYAEIDAADALAQTSQNRRADVLEVMERGDEAGRLLQSAAEAPDADSDVWVRLGDWHRRAERNLPAAEAYSRAIALDGDTSSWALWFLRGSMKERAGDWLGAEADLREALRQRPDEPVVLNYLGYSLLDRGLKMAEATSLIEKAASLRPADGGIIDSLGWSQFRQGQFVQAVETLEKAAELEPADPTVNEHLGDAYWRIGRRIEARFRWQAAMALDPSESQRASLIARLDYGLDAALAMAN
jgi:Flp pilus assembly protein TadD